MIAFGCTQCSMKFQVKDEFAGRATRCPTCKIALVVPAPAVTLAPAPAENSAKSVARHAHGAGVTLSISQGEPSVALAANAVSALIARHAANGARYVIENEIARGGMGAVMRALDCDIRREVALKFLLDQKDPHKTMRLIEEAQITGQLEHPNIVPVHELSIDSEQRVFFSMKMVRGRSLAQILDALRTHAAGVEKEFTLNKLLNILVNVCHALAYAHSLGVVHRDLKPANIMVGDFGEVYVMDWGLAKVLSGSESPSSDKPASLPAGPDADGTDHSASQPDSVNQSVTGSGSGHVVTSRQAETDLTVEGTVMGTPVYMPPEQAAGHVQEIGRHSDIYSLGAILYEILAWHPPVEKEGGFKAVLRRVIEGDIVPPARRNPARGSKIPQDLAAIAMKALAKDPSRRYPTIESLRRDIELFQEGRSVSAKEDTKRELIRKFIRRNKAFSAATAVAALLVVAILIGSSWINYRERKKAEKAYRDSVAAQDEIKARTLKAVPALVAAARLGVERRDFANAQTQVGLALTYDPGFADALLLRGQLLILERDFAAAHKDLEKYVKVKPQDKLGRELRDLCARPDAGNEGSLLVIHRVFVDQQFPALAEALLQKSAAEFRDSLLPLYQMRINGAWKGATLGSRLRLEANGTFSLDLTNAKAVGTLDPLKGIPLTRLVLTGCTDVRDLSPLEGMPLNSLALSGCAQLRDIAPLPKLPLISLSLNRCSAVEDFMPLKDMKLTFLDLGFCKIDDLSLLQGLPLSELVLDGCLQVSELTALQAMPLTQLSLRGCARVRDVTPLAGLKLKSLGLPTQPVMGVEALRKMATLTTINGRPAEEFWKKLSGAGK
jgi:serine/threonine protein kinase